MSKKYGKTIRGLPVSYRTPLEMGRHEEASTLSDKLRSNPDQKDTKEFNNKNTPDKAPKELDVADVRKDTFYAKWVDTNTFVPDEKGELKPAGTSLILGPNIIYLKFLEDWQLNQLKEQVMSAVDYELNKRQ